MAMAPFFPDPVFGDFAENTFDGQFAQPNKSNSSRSNNNPGAIGSGMSMDSPARDADYAQLRATSQAIPTPQGGVFGSSPNVGNKTLAGSANDLGGNMDGSNAWKRDYAEGFRRRVDFVPVLSPKPTPLPVPVPVISEPNNAFSYGTSSELGSTFDGGVWGPLRADPSKDDKGGYRLPHSRSFEDGSQVSSGPEYTEPVFTNQKYSQSVIEGSRLADYFASISMSNNSNNPSQPGGNPEAPISRPSRNSNVPNGSSLPIGINSRGSVERSEMKAALLSSSPFVPSIAKAVNFSSGSLGNSGNPSMHNSSNFANSNSSHNLQYAGQPQYHNLQPQQQQQQQQPAGKIFVGGLSWETSEASLKEYFGRYGTVLDCVIMRDRTSGHPRGFGFVTFEDENVADTVAAEKHELDGRVVEAKRAVPRSDCTVAARPPPVKSSRKLFVGGLPSACGDMAFREYFSGFGEIQESQVMYDHQTGNSRGFGFVTFVDDKVVDGIMELDHDIMGKRIEIKLAEPKHMIEAKKSREMSVPKNSGALGASTGPMNVPSAIHSMSMSGMPTSVNSGYTREIMIPSRSSVSQAIFADNPIPVSADHGLNRAHYLSASAPIRSEMDRFAHGFHNGVDRSRMPFYGDTFSGIPAWDGVGHSGVDSPLLEAPKSPQRQNGRYPDEPVDAFANQYNGWSYVPGSLGYSEMGGQSAAGANDSRPRPAPARHSNSSMLAGAPGGMANGHSQSMHNPGSFMSYQFGDFNDPSGRPYGQQ